MLQKVLKIKINIRSMIWTLTANNGWKRLEDRYKYSGESEKLDTAINPVPNITVNRYKRWSTFLTGPWNVFTIYSWTKIFGRWKVGVSAQILHTFWLYCKHISSLETEVCISVATNIFPVTLLHGWTETDSSLRWNAREHTKADPPLQCIGCTTSNTLLWRKITTLLFRELTRTDLVHTRASWKNILLVLSGPKG